MLVAINVDTNLIACPAGFRLVWSSGSLAVRIWI